MHHPKDYAQEEETEWKPGRSVDRIKRQHKGEVLEVKKKQEGAKEEKVKEKSVYNINMQVPSDQGR